MGCMAAVGALRAQAPLLDARPVRHLRVQPPAGTAWHLQRSLDGGQSWQWASGPHFSDGSPLLLTESAGPPTDFRMVPANLADHPFPASPAGWTALLVRDGGVSEVVFMSASRGFFRLDAGHARPFTCTWRRSGPDRAEAILTYSDGSHVLLRLALTNGSLGHWGMEGLASPAAAATVREPVESGTLQFVEGRLRRLGRNPEIAADLHGLQFLFDEGGARTLVRFTDSQHAEIAPPDGPVRAVTYNYERETLAKGRVSFQPGGTELILEMNGPGTGIFQEVLPEQPPAGAPPFFPPRQGSFTTPVQRETPRDGACPPPSLSGLAFIVHGSSPCTLTFNADGTGTASKEINGSVEVTAFTWAYSRTGGAGASVALTFPGVSRDLIDDYQFDFSSNCSGRFRRDSYASGSATGAVSGTFTPAPTGG